MPTYDYECLKCGNSFEAFQNMTDDCLTKCQDETCDGKVKRLIGTGAGLLFKGSGFYTTDYRSDSYKAGAKQESGKSESKKPTPSVSKDSKSSKSSSPGAKKADS
jgi:putative FmdB family regulatory protein